MSSHLSQWSQWSLQWNQPCGTEAGWRKWRRWLWRRLMTTQSEPWGGGSGWLQLPWGDLKVTNHYYVKKTRVFSEERSLLFDTLLWYRRVCFFSCPWCSAGPAFTGQSNVSMIEDAALIHTLPRLRCWLVNLSNMQQHLTSWRDSTRVAHTH